MKRATILYGDQLMIIYAREILSRKPGATIIGEVKSSQNMYDDIRAPRRQRDDVEDRAFADQGADAGDRTPNWRAR